MNELVHMVSERIGVPEDKARQAVEVVMGYLKDRLPGPIAGGLNQFIGDAGSADSNEAEGLNNIFGGKKAS